MEQSGHLVEKVAAGPVAGEAYNPRRGGRGVVMVVSLPVNYRP